MDIFWKSSFCILPTSFFNRNELHSKNPTSSLASSSFTKRKDDDEDDCDEDVLLIKERVSDEKVFVSNLSFLHLDRFLQEIYYLTSIPLISFGKVKFILVSFNRENSRVKKKIWKNDKLKSLNKNKKYVFWFLYVCQLNFHHCNLTHTIKTYWKCVKLEINSSLSKYKAWSRNPVGKYYFDNVAKRKIHV